MSLTQFVHSDCTFPKFQNSIVSRFFSRVTANDHASGNHFGNVFGVDSVSVVLTWVVWQEGKLSHDQLEYRCFENAASDLIDCAAHINDEITTQQELVARLRLINSCRMVLVAVGFTISMDRKPLVLEDYQEGLATRRG
ncbi:hypothetical protein SAMN05444169_2983 [Bradyrhizobium erythrophlei]|uniref:Uncharacterized protein n=1 Tax=Bradyrhizobium erythrophlei TaxID=1437360 RepID=A0A1M5KP57_9BRAD|nr:hypothetical protein SAMN05444169_2983 [Bradyrhizobium erythrophlei]